jgi:hypothetical protein
MLGARFRHGGLAPFIPMPMNILINEVVLAEEVFGNEINELTFRLCESAYDASSINSIQNYLAKRIHNEVDTRQALRLIFLGKGIRILTTECPQRKVGCSL